MVDGRDQYGASLLEVLITLVLTAIGLLGVAGLVLGSLKAGSDAQWRARAALLSEEAVARMRANHGWKFTGDQLELVADPYANRSCAGGTAANPDVTGNLLGAGRDLKAWQQWSIDAVCAKVGSVDQGGLPGGRLQVSRQAADVSERGVSRLETYRVEVSWCAQLEVADTLQPASALAGCSPDRTRHYVTHVSF
ncbi:type IV pilus modification PilV family protein [Crenobacter caeni]|uniref:Type IV pilus modification protein PilV n=1 Tax=Crenobacter caeni TaxID=2705474 RepID=A0A6B2KS99_9NEIS|nr:prepilin-type N-terminal cleavage/methylation domain-containing protein [Crenobacter caeni]NDV13115.1 hypothetical protein [Crenobacter caeni]